jgi:hypothetical protein
MWIILMQVGSSIGPALVLNASAKFACRPFHHKGTQAQRNKNVVSAWPGDLGVKPGDRIDFYRVEALEPDRLLLHSELTAPGEAWLEWRVSRTVGREVGRTGSPTYLTPTTFFAPRGLQGTSR